MEEEGYLALRWNNHNTIFTKILNLLREQEAYTDVSLACDGRIYAAHKFVLSTCSDYFKTMFSNSPCKHPVVFMKDVTCKDIESLLDFMYKGEVHVPQSELGSLLRTAEGLQVKGLAVPDDTARATNLVGSPSSPTPGTVAPAVPPAGSLINEAAASSPKSAFRNASLPVKRKRSSDSSKKDEPPRLTPGGELFNLTIGKNSKSGKGRSGGAMPELKRFKPSPEEKVKRKSGNHRVKQEPPTNAIETTNLPLPAPDPNGLIPIANIKEEVDPKSFEVHEDQLFGRLENDLDEEEEEEAENAPGPPEEDEEDEEEEDDEERRVQEGPPEGNSTSPALPPSEGDENSSLPNSEISTAELLQVDLSEDGTQFIIAPGGIGGEASRTSSTAEEDGSEGPKKPFVCLLCGHTFTRRDNLANHLKTHTGDRPFMCQYCHKCFSRKDYLKQHERIHTGEKPYACDICGRAFTRKEGLTDHMRCHSDFKAFACETCGKSFKQKCGLRFHKRNYRH